MYPVVLRADLQQDLEQEAENQQRSVTELVNEAVQDYLRQRAKEKIGREQAAYERMHPSLKNTHFGKWVAVHEGQLVDCDDDDAALHQRVRARYGDAAILITRVEDEAMREIRTRTPSIGRPGR
jgi:hypothetical protein